MLLILLLACPVKETHKPGTDDTNDSAVHDSGVDDSGVDDSGEPDETGEILLPPAVTALVSVEPATLPSDKGGSITFIAATAETESALKVYSSPDVGFSVRVGETDVPVTVAVSGTDLLFSFVMPSEARPAGGRVVYALSMNGTSFLNLPVALSANLETVADRLSSEGWSLAGSNAAKSCGETLLDSDSDGVVELVSVGIEGDCVVVGRACPVDGGTCLETKLDVCTESGGDPLLCGSTTHFRTSGSGVEAVLATLSEKGELIEVSELAWTGGSWTGTGVASSTAIFGAVLGLNTSKEDKSVPLALLVSSSSGVGTFVGVDRTFEWTAIGSTTAKNVLAGTAFAGLFSAVDLSRGSSSSEVWTWALDASSADRGTITGSVFLPNEEASSFTRVRDFSLSSPDFSVELMTASGEDLDGDGHPELLVEAWGEGRHQVWVVMAATDKSDSRPVRALEQYCGGTDNGEVSCGMLASVYGDGTLDSVVVAAPTLVLNDSTLASTQAEGVGSAPSGEWLENRTFALNYSLSELLVDDATAVPTESASHIGQTLAKGGGSCSNRGSCRFGSCFCTPGFGGSSLRVAGGGSGSEVVDAELTAGDLVFVGPDEPTDSMIVRRTTYGRDSRYRYHARREAYHLASGTELVAGAGLSVINGGNILVSDSSVFTIDRSSSLSITGGSLKLGETNAVVVSTVENRSTGASELGFTDGVTSVEGLVLPTESTVGGSSTPVLLSAHMSDDHGALFSWRDGLGQAWLALVDIDAAMASSWGKEVPFLEGPFAVGSAVADTENVLGLSLRRPGAVGLSHFPVDGALFSMDNLPAYINATRSGPPEWRCEDACLDAVVITTGGDGSTECPWQTWYLPGATTLEEMVGSASVLASSSDKTCSNLQIPLAAYTSVADIPAFVALGTPGGSLSSVFLDDSGIVAEHAIPGSARADYDNTMFVSSTDVDGDALADLVVTGWSTAGSALYLSTGDGAFVDSGIEASVMTNFAVLLGGSPGTCGDVDFYGGERGYYGVGNHAGIYDWVRR